MKIDINAFMDSLPIMGVGLLGIFIVTIVLIIGIYILKAITSKIDEKAVEEMNEENEEDYDSDMAEIKAETKKESAMDLMKEREKKDFFKEEESNYISQDL
ncbi:MAG: hypothetical protein J5517_02790 [Eubacterium sp.]|nr:hypothetical protein [Eubacterium sp.]